MLSAKWTNTRQDEKDNYYQRFLPTLLSNRCKKKPLLVIIDEAHTLDPEMGATLLNISQQLRNMGRPFMLILAGTPELPSHLRKMESTFWERSDILSLQLLDTNTKERQEQAIEKDPDARDLPMERFATDTRSAITEPLKKYQITCDNEALDEIVRDSQGYPYFIQLWGEAICKQLTENRSREVNLDIITAAKPDIAIKRKDFYQKRYNEMQKDGLLRTACTITKLFNERENVPDWEIDRALEHVVTNNQEQATLKEKLNNHGYIWQPTGASEPLIWRPGIPSLMTFVKEEQEKAL